VRWLALLLLFTSTVSAQIVNVQPLLAKHEMRPGLGLALEASLDWRTGNVNLLLAAANLVARYRHGRHHLFLLGHAEIGIKSGESFSLQGPGASALSRRRRGPARSRDLRAARSRRVSPLRRCAWCGAAARACAWS